MKLEISYDYEIGRLAKKSPVLIATRFELANATVTEMEKVLNLFCGSKIQCSVDESLYDRLLEHLDSVKNSKMLFGFTESDTGQYGLEALLLLPNNHFRVAAVILNGITTLYEVPERKKLTPKVAGL